MIVPGVAASSPGRRVAGRRSLRRLLVAALLLAVVGAIAYTAYVGALGSAMIVDGESKPLCMTPAQYGWEYEAINYDVADDDRLAARYPDMTRCDDQGMAPGTEVVTSDGIRLDGWYIPSGDADPPEAATVVLGHGWSSNKSDLLRYAATLHDEFNLLLFDQRHSGRSTGDQHTFGAKEALDLSAMIDWLVRTKGPTAIGVLGDSGGGAMAAMLARTDPRIDALVLDSVHARHSDPLAERAADEGQPAYPGIWGMQVGFWLRTGVGLGDADPVDSVARLGSRPLLLIHGTADEADLPEKSVAVNLATALKAGVDVEVRLCPGATHGKVVDTCTAEYGDWVGAFFTRAFAGD